MDSILESTLSEIEAAFRQLYEHHYPPMRFLTDMGNPLPRAFHSAAEFILNTDLRRALSGETLDVERIKGLLEEARAWNVELDTEGLSYLLQQTLGRMMAGFVSNPDDIFLLNSLVAAVELARSTPFAVDLWKVQNLYYEMPETTYPEYRKRTKADREWLTQFASLGGKLSIRTT
jgi:hypothetical protein